MPSLEEAREQAFTYGDGVCFLCRWEGESVGVPGPYNKATEAGPFCERHNAGGQYDEQRIAALVPTEADCFCDEAYTKRGLQDHACHYHYYDWLWEELRALAGQVAREEVPE